MSASSQSAAPRTRRIAHAVFSAHHRNIGFGYLTISAVAVIIGTILSWLMRAHLAWPNWNLPLHGPILPEDYLALVTMHGTLMLFFVLTVAPQSGFGNLILPAQLGARRMAFPRLNALGMWITAAGLAVLLCAFFVPGGSPIAGWTSYPPLSASSLSGPGEGPGQDIWLLSLALFCIGGTISAVVTLTTIVKLRCEGMTWRRLPLTVWGWFTAAMLAVLAFSVLLAAILLLFCDRHLGSAFFIPRGDFIDSTTILRHGSGSPLLWLHLFWFFGHPEVYIAILPGMGLTSMVLANFARRRVFAYRLMIATTLAIGLLGIIVWGHHMFVAGLNPFAGTAFAAASMAIAIPATAKVLSWLATVWRSRPQLSTAMLFALGFVSLFVAGGLSGIIVAQPILDEYLHNTFFVVGHFHLIMAMAGVFGLFCATYYWFPLLFNGCMLSERIGRWHFWLTFVFAYTTFLPMYFSGLAGEPRHYAQLTGLNAPAQRLLGATGAAQLHITAGAFALGLTQLLFFFNILRTLRTPPLLIQNPWSATTMEWSPNAFAEPADDLPAPIVYHRPCHYADDGLSFFPQWLPSPSTKEMESTSKREPE
ncbi:MAG TPA: cbb3-type cytochrome c oxidase subunit I [Candidatus Aquilonibacter sp.]|nr:cbb3-type cytochrome c oxidase subunit I [Candidatus Aquilonibacter sp.]